MSSFSAGKSLSSNSCSNSCFVLVLSAAAERPNSFSMADDIISSDSASFPSSFKPMIRASTCASFCISAVIKSLLYMLYSTSYHYYHHRQSCRRQILRNCRRHRHCCCHLPSCYCRNFFLRQVTCSRKGRPQHRDYQ